jgi:hypothetical protein
MPDPKNLNPERGPDNQAADSGAGVDPRVQRTFLHRILLYVPSLLRDERVSIGVLLFDPNTGERRLRLIREESEFSRLRHLRPRADEEILRYLRDHLESRLSAAAVSNANGGPVRSTLRNGQGNPADYSTDWFPILEKWDATLSNSLQLSEPKLTIADDINAELDRLYEEHVTGPSSSRPRVQPGDPRTRPQMRHYMDQVLRQAGLWGLIETFVPASMYTHDHDPLLIDYSYLRSDNKVRGFVQTISLTEKADDVRIFVPLAKAIQERAPRPKPDLIPEFTAVTDINFESENPEHAFLEKMLKNNGITPIPLDNFAVWAAKLRPMVQ